MTGFKGLFSIRDGKDSDKNFILATFLRGLYYGDSKDNTPNKLKFYSLIPKNIFMENYQPVAEALLASPSTTVVVACLPDDPDVILGYSILSTDFQTVHWVYVKAAWRNKGVGRSLVPQHPQYVTHLSEVGYNLLSKYENLTFNPFAIG